MVGSNWAGLESKGAARVRVVERQLQDALFAVVDSESRGDRSSPALCNLAVQREFDQVLGVLGVGDFVLTRRVADRASR